MVVAVDLRFVMDVQGDSLTGRVSRPPRHPAHPCASPGHRVGACRLPIDAAIPVDGIGAGGDFPGPPGRA